MRTKSKEKIYIVGHKNPDTDTICSSIAYARFLKQKGKRAQAFRSGEINPETKFVLDYFKFPLPKRVSGLNGKKVILLDHNEKTQSPEGIDRAQILEVIDHHKINFQCSDPIFFLNEPLGSTSTIIAKKYLQDKKVKMSREIAGILLSGILSDTVAFRSATTTKEDIEIAKKLAKFAKIRNFEKFGIEIKKKKAGLKGLKAKDIINSDFKDFLFSNKKIGVGQVEISDLKEAAERKEELFRGLKEIKESGKYRLVVLMLTDIIKGSSLLLAEGKIEYLEKAFGKKIKNNSLYLKGVMSRKKEIIPPLMKVIK